MAALLLDLGPGDEVIMPSFTFVSTANAFVLRGATPVFVDIRPDTLNLDERLIEAAITPRTTAIVAVHYAGVACEMDAICDIAAAPRTGRHRGRGAGADVAVQGTAARLVRPPGGAQLSRDEERDLAARAARWSSTTRGSSSAPRSSGRRAPTARSSRAAQVDKYTWVDVGSSFLPSELDGGVPVGAARRGRRASRPRRLRVWRRYRDACARARSAGRAASVVPADCVHNAHLFYVLLPAPARGASVLAELNAPRRPRRLPLRAAAFRAGGPAIRARVRSMERHRRLQRAPGPAAAVGGDACRCAADDRGTAAGERRCCQREVTGISSIHRAPVPAAGPSGRHDREGPDHKRQVNVGVGACVRALTIMSRAKRAAATRSPFGSVPPLLRVIP